MKIFRDKGGFIRIVEAFVAILLITGVVLYVLSNKGLKSDKTQEKIYDTEDVILKEISRIQEYREKIVAYNTTQPDEKDKEFIAMLQTVVVNPKIPSGFSSAINICEPEIQCPLPIAYPEKDVEIYSRSRAISATLEQYSPKQLRIFIWRG